jgi:putative ABC transport system ATP-binding protein
VSAAGPAAPIERDRSPFDRLRVSGHDCPTAAAAPPLLSLRDVSRSYRAGAVVVPALRGVSLDVAPGELVALVGPSGSGKSTLLHVCGLIDDPDEGSYRFEGQETRALGPAAQTRLRRERIGFVFQGFNLVPVLTSFENVEVPLLLAKVGRAERRRRVREALEAVGLSDQAARRPDRLSGGQRQRVAIARALVKRPRLVLADEPTANLDGATAGQVIEVMRALGRAQGVTFLVATHDARLTPHCDRTVALKDGVLA